MLAPHDVNAQFIHPARRPIGVEMRPFLHEVEGDLCRPNDQGGLVWKIQEDYVAYKTARKLTKQGGGQVNNAPYFLDHSL